MTGDNRSRGELGRFLRSRRERVKPEHVGLPVGPRRRAPGLRREEVAVLAGLSPTWYTYLEQGRDIHPSPEVLNSIARVLQFTEDERRYMHTLAYGQVMDAKPLDTEIPPTEMLRQVAALTDLSPYPMYVGNAINLDLVAWNRAATEWYDDWGQYPPEERNILRWLFTANKARERLVDWEYEAKNIMARWRAEVAKRPDDTRVRQLVADLSRLSPEFVRWWDDYDVEEHRSRIRRLRHPQRGVQVMRVVYMQSPEFLVYGIVFHVPAVPGTDGQREEVG